MIAACALGILTGGCAGHQAGLTPSVPTVTDASAIAAKAAFASANFSLKLTPNFAPGFGDEALPGHACGAPLDPPNCQRPGPGATLRNGSVDFGTVESDRDFIYHHAVDVSVSSKSAFVLYASALGDITDGSSTIPAYSLLSVRENIPTTWGIAPIPFQTASEGGPVVIASGGAGSYHFKYSYILRVPDSTPVGSYSTQVLYTAVP